MTNTNYTTLCIQILASVPIAMAAATGQNDSASQTLDNEVANIDDCTLKGYSNRCNS
ncbi:MAG: hypothetical protein WBF33_16610 [Candidatus Nitrosopolaris sp.]